MGRAALQTSSTSPSPCWSPLVQNVLLTGSGHAKLADVGLAQSLPASHSYIGSGNQSARARFQRCCPAQTARAPPAARPLPTHIPLPLPHTHPPPAPRSRRHPRVHSPRGSHARPLHQQGRHFLLWGAAARDLLGRDAQPHAHPQRADAVGRGGVARCLAAIGGGWACARTYVRALNGCRRHLAPCRAPPDVIRLFKACVNGDPKQRPTAEEVVALLEASPTRVGAPTFHETV